jgi:hypothetical protein
MYKCDSCVAKDIKILLVSCCDKNERKKIKNHKNSQENYKVSIFGILFWENEVKVCFTFRGIQ